jgi:hypothetical protein
MKRGFNHGGKLERAKKIVTRRVLPGAGALLAVGGFIAGGVAMTNGVEETQAAAAANAAKEAEKKAAERVKLERQLEQTKKEQQQFLEIQETAPETAQGAIAAIKERIKDSSDRGVSQIKELELSSAVGEGLVGYGDVTITGLSDIGEVSARVQVLDPRFDNMSTVTWSTQNAQVIEVGGVDSIVVFQAANEPDEQENIEAILESTSGTATKTIVMNIDSDAPGSGYSDPTGPAGYFVEFENNNNDDGTTTVTDRGNYYFKDIKVRARNRGFLDIEVDHGYIIRNDRRTGDEDVLKMLTNVRKATKS